MTAENDAPRYNTPTGEHPDLIRLREREERAIAQGYTEGDVNHNVQPIIGHMRLRMRDGEPLDADFMAYAVERLTKACDAEIAWLATRPTPPVETDGAQ